MSAMRRGEGFADLHQHVLWGVDDGPQSAEEMRALLERDAAEGIGLVAATAHAYPRTQPFDLALYRERLAEANEYCRARGLPLAVVAGCEIHDAERVPDLLAAGKLPALGDSRCALIEFREDASLDEVGATAGRLYTAGFVPVVAHAERIRCLARRPERAIEAREEYGVILQVNCDTVLAPRGFFERRFVARMLRAEAVDLIATDAHGASRRPPRMREAMAAVRQRCGEDYARRLEERAWRLLGLAERGGMESE